MSLIQILPAGPMLTDFLHDCPGAQRWALCSTGQAFAADRIEPPSALRLLSSIEPLGGNLLHLLLRPSLKQLSSDAPEAGDPGSQSERMLEIALEMIDDLPDQWGQLRDVFGLRAVDYDERRILPVDESLQETADATNQMKLRRARSIIRSLTRRDMVRSDLFRELTSARKALGVDLYPGLRSNCPANLRRTMLNYCDLLQGRITKLRQK